jgi:hypothetical protein
VNHFFKNLVLCTSLAALGAFATWIALRPRLPRGEGFTDGEQFLAATRARDELRLARWEPPKPVEGGINTGADESRPFLDRASGEIYFVVGDEAGSSDLWLATPEAGGTWVTRPIRELDTPGRELSPWFADGWLYFASDRAGGLGGLDLWRSRRIGERFQPPENLGGTVNSSADEVDPAWRSPAELWFASNRGAGSDGSFDLYTAKRADGVFESPQPVESLNSPYDERTPAFTPDGRVLFFASNRPGGRGGFDLWRSLCANDRFQPPTNLGAPNGPGDDTGPTLADDGFTLLFASVRDGGGQSDLYRTRTRELFPVEAPAFTLADFTILILLGLVALLAWLARRWEALDVLYKCMVVSLLLHLLFLWYSRRVDVEAVARDLGHGDDTYEVQLLGNVLDAVAAMGDRAVGDQVGEGEGGDGGEQIARALSRGSLLPSSAPDSAPGEAGAFERTSSAAPSSAPQASEHAIAPSRVAAVTKLGGDPVAGPQEKFERIGGEAAAPALAPSRDLDGNLEEGRTASDAGGSAGDAPRFVSLAGGGGADAGPDAAEAGGAPIVRAGGDGEGDGGGPLPGREGRDERPATEAQRGGAAAVIATHGPSDRFEGAKETGRGALPSSPDLRPSRGGLGEQDGGGAAVVTAGPDRGAFGKGGANGRGASGTSGESVREVGPATGEKIGGATRAQPSELPAGGGGRGRGARGAGAGGELTRPDLAPVAVAVHGPKGEAPPGGGEGNGKGGSSGNGEGNAKAPTLALGPANLSGVTGGGDGGGANGGAGPAHASLSNLGGSGSGSGDPSGGPVHDPDGRGSAPIAGRANGGGSGFGVPGRRAPLAGESPASSAGGGPGVALTAPTDRADPKSVAGGNSPVAGSGPAPGLALAPSLALGTARGDGGVGVAQGPARASFGTGGGGVPDLGPAAKGGKLDLPGASGPGVGSGEGSSAAPAGAPRLYERRFGDAKEVALREGGGSVETERAVQGGLRYLAKIQRPKGYFGDANGIDLGSKYRDVRVGKTGLAVLAFLGAGHTQQSKTAYSDNVARAVQWIIERQDPASGHFGNSDAYSHGIATYALAECYAITHDPKLVDPLVRGLNHLLDMQQQNSQDSRKEGGWTYYYKDGPGVDGWPRASVSAWQVMALESAKVGGLEVPQEALDSAKEYFIRSFDPKFGGFRYTHSPEWLHNQYGTLPASTPASMFVLTLLGEKNDPAVRAAERFVTDRIPTEYKYRGQDAFVRRGTGNVYFMYYGTLALFVRGGAPWRNWNEALKSTLLPAQKPDGSWDCIDEYARNFALDDPNDKSYTTSMCVLMLEVYYRYFTPLLGKFGEK